MVAKWSVKMFWFSRTTCKHGFSFESALGKFARLAISPFGSTFTFWAITFQKLKAPFQIAVFQQNANISMLAGRPHDWQRATIGQGDHHRMGWCFNSCFLLFLLGPWPILLEQIFRALLFRVLFTLLVKGLWMHQAQQSIHFAATWQRQVLFLWVRANQFGDHMVRRPQLKKGITFIIFQDRLFRNNNRSALPRNGSQLLHFHCHGCWTPGK